MSFFENVGLMKVVSEFLFRHLNTYDGLFSDTQLDSKEDLVRALDKHALRVGSRHRRRLIEVCLCLLDKTSN